MRSIAALVALMLACGSSPVAGGDAGGPDASAADAPAGDALADAPAGDAPVGKACTGCPPPVACQACWKPPADARWQYQLQGDPNTTITAAPYGGGTPVAPDVFDVDLYASDGTTPDSAATAALHAAGRRAVCYVDAGTYEDFRPDAADYTAFDSACGGCLLGQNNGWPGEKWLNIDDDQGQRTFILGEVGKRMDLCASAGFDGVELDNVDGYANSTGFSFSAATQELFDASLANLAHEKGLSVALKNDLDQVADLEPYFDYAVNEQCFEYAECASLDPFVAAGKAVFNVEYDLSPSQFCPNAGALNAIQKTLALTDTPWTPCR
jgi:hypothetical protein